MTDVFIGKYKVIRKLGAGGMASVYLASHRDVPSLRTVLKELGDIQLADRFRREADKLAQLDGHGGICQIKHFFEAEGKFYIVMEYIEGPTLDELVRGDNPPDLLRCLDITRSILGTLDFAHRMGVVHRDIKPTNIMIDRIGQVKIIDFGIAKGAADPDLTQVGASLGSPRYMAPEQFNAAAAIDWVRCDIYAVGVTLYFLLTRDYPFKAASIHEMCEAKRLGLVEPPSRLNPAIPPWLEAVVLRAMAKDPAERYASAAEMRAALDDPGPDWVPPPVAHDGTMVLGPGAGAATVPPRPRDAGAGGHDGGLPDHGDRGHAAADAGASLDPGHGVGHQGPAPGHRRRRGGAAGGRGRGAVAPRPRRTAAAARAGGAGGRDGHGGAGGGVPLDRPGGGRRPPHGPAGR